MARITKNRLGYSVPSASGNGSYVVGTDDGRYCTCPDFERRQEACKHVFAALVTIQREELSDGSVRETKAVTVKHTQHWPSYNAAQMHEGEHLATLLRELVDTVPNQEYTFGRPTLPMSDILYGLGVKVYSGKSGCRAMSEIRSAKAQGLLDKMPSFAVLGKYIQDTAITPVIQDLITLSSLPLSTVEREFATDGTGFASGSYNHWHDEKWGDEEGKRKKVWVKATLTTGVKTNIIVKADVTVHPHGESPYLIPHLNTVAKHFAIDPYSADKAYLAKDILEAIDKIGAKVLIPFKKNSVPHLVMEEGDEVWNRLLAYYMFNRAEFDKHYHKRSNVEASIGAIKAKLQEKLRSKTGSAMVNEVLLKVLSYNITVLVHSMYELGVNINFPELAHPGVRASDIW